MIIALVYPIADAGLMGFGELLENIKFNANSFFPIISEGIDGATRNSLLLTLSSFITFIIFKIIVRLVQRKEKNIEIKKINKNISDSINNLKSTLEISKVKFHSSRTFIRGFYIYISIHDLYLYMNGSKDIVFKILHELSHKKSGDLLIGSLNKYSNKILYYLLSIMYLYLLMSFFEDIVMYVLLNTIGFTADFYIIFTNFTFPLYLLLSFYITYKFYNKYNMPSFFKECCSDRYAHIIMTEKGYVYSNNIFNNSESVNHPSKDVRISCAGGSSYIGKNLIKYYTVIFVLSLFPSLSSQELSFFNLMQILLIISYISILFSIYRINHIIMADIDYLPIISIPLLIFIKFFITYASFFVFVNDVYSIEFNNVIATPWFIFQSKEVLLLTILSVIFMYLIKLKKS